jgi:hypothetical protein
MARPCPKCSRPNNERAPRCLYCGTAFPDTPPPEPVAATPESADAAPVEEKKKPEAFLVVVAPSQELPKERLALFSNIMNTDDYTAKQKLKYPAPWSSRVFPDAAGAQALTKKFTELGVDAYVLKQSGLDKVTEYVQADSLKTLGDDEIVFHTVEEEEIVLTLKKIHLVVRGRIKEKLERDEDVSEERPNVNLGKMMINTEGQEIEKGTVGDVLTRIEIPARASRLRWVLRGGAAIEIMDIYQGSSHVSVRLVESEFDYSGLGEIMKPSGLLNYTHIFRHIVERAPQAKVDQTFNTVGYSLTEMPKQDRVRNELETVYGVSDSAKKMFDNRAFFDDHSGRVYLHYLRQRQMAKKANA